MASPEGGWGLNVGAFISYHRSWAINGTATSWTAHRRNASGTFGPVLGPRMLDELDALIEDARPDPGKHGGEP